MQLLALPNCEMTQVISKIRQILLHILASKFSNIDSSIDIFCDIQCCLIPFAVNFGVLVRQEAVSKAKSLNR